MVRTGDGIDRRVVLVDDDPIVLAAIGEKLKHLGLDVISFSDAGKGLEAIHQVKPCMCIVDWMMPGLDGLAMVRQIRNDPDVQDTYVIMLTAKDRSEELVAAFEAGVDDYLAKSACKGEIAARINAALRVIKLQEELAGRIDTITGLNRRLIAANEHLNDMASTDVLTCMPNRRSAYERLGQLWSGWVRHRTPVCVAMIDIDHFKMVNDMHGHDAGDDVLRHVSSILKNQTRQADVMGRYGGEEFIIGISHQSIDEVVAGLDRLRVDIKSSPARSRSGVITTSVSIGVAEVGLGISSLEDLIKAADMALYEAKRSGRDRVVCRQDSELVSK